MPTKSKLQYHFHCAYMLPHRNKIVKRKKIYFFISNLRMARHLLLSKLRTPETCFLKNEKMAKKIFPDRSLALTTFHPREMLHHRNLFQRSRFSTHVVLFE